MTKIVATVLILAASSSVSYANEIVFGDGNHLLRACKHTIRFSEGEHSTDEWDKDIGYCLGFVSGVMGTMHIEAARAKLVNAPEVYCIPEIANGQAARIVVKFLEEGPEKLHEPAVLLAYRAFLDAYPCKGESN